MNTTQQYDTLQMAEELERSVNNHHLYWQGKIAAELRRLHAENVALQAGYDAARLEIASLQAKAKATAEEHADELMVAHLGGKMRATQMTFDGLTEEETMAAASCTGLTTEPAGAYPAMLEITEEDRSFLHYNPNTADIVELVQKYARACIDADRAMRAAQPAGAQQPGVAYVAAAAILEEIAQEPPINGNHLAQARVLMAADSLRASHWQAPAQAVPAAVAGPSEILEKINSLISSINEAHRSQNSGWKQGCFDAADNTYKQIKDMLYAAPTTQAAPTTDSYVQPVPDKCDRITWRGSYYHLPLKAPQQPVPAPAVVTGPSDEAAIERTRDLASNGRWPSDWIEAYCRGYADAAPTNQPAPASHSQTPAQAAPELTETAVTAKNPAAPVSSLEDSRTQAVYEVLVNDNYPPAGSNEHWEGWKARLIVDALFPIETPAAVTGPLNELEELNLLNKLIALGAKAAQEHAQSNSDDGHKGTAAYVQWQELRAEMGELIRNAYAAPTAQATPRQEAQEPVAWQRRTRPTWGGNTRPWSPWESCTKEQAGDYWKTPLLNDWAYEARALYTAPQPTTAPLSNDLRDMLVAISEAIANQDDRAAQAMLREILKAPQLSTATQGDAPDVAHKERCQHCIDRHDGVYGSWAAPCPYHDDDGNPRIDAARKQGEKHD